MPSIDELVRIQQAHHRRMLGIQAATGDLVGAAWDAFGGLNDAAAAEFTAAANIVVEAAKVQTSTIATAYMSANDRLHSHNPLLIPTLPEIRGGVSPIDVLLRSIITSRKAIADGGTFPEAMAAGRGRAVSTARTDIILTNRATINAAQASRPWVVGYRRVLTGRSCAFCATASTQRYKSADLMPLHPNCDCDVAEIVGTRDPGSVINRGLLNSLKAAGREDGVAQYWSGPYVVDADGTIHRKITKTVELADGKTAQRVEAGTVVRTKTETHPELGQVLVAA